ncbi:FAD binding domain-containing protein [Gordonia sp. Z-3]|jgi:CO/xanthine dehydrogenase FAD-binding subunit|uniref:FAD binding domain-containing protein n=2 Tax=Gordonia TaxID=2053 RepID=A0A9X3I5X8_9ACTN|nr:MULTISPECIES: FAD binding domain-containing protein [Gordonia]MAU83210.1 FAD-binding molybdopterin dehydrogenase [Gordonia sp. (in: high G+C Gram-positive bacteria)]MAU83622.1 FAD-binding molybdopterin dehydrogenase [Gordonia sp. (in: high G+C Gram-positive bacteria)]MCF3939148.1 FAD binding domain-containing protein [Gordonia tangerina]MCX2964949.1 FAD binding domain-containing protein [Gordonia aquimaris]MED5801357.1 FAD binding domain-containing protein [Gordonia sp. Z-3]
MDLNTIDRYRYARTREDLRLGPGERVVAGGTWFFSEPQVDADGIVDLTTMGWPAFEDLPDDGLRIGATCPIVEITRLPARSAWRAQPLFSECANALLASFKIWNVATVGGNICRSFAAASMVSLAAGLDATAVIWCPDGSERRTPVAELITGNGTNSLGDAEILRAIDIPGTSMQSVTAFRKIALAELGRSGAVVTGRRDEDGTLILVVTAATLRPHVMRFDAIPTIDELHDRVVAADDFYTDPLGSADWRRATSAVLAEEIRAELAGGVTA